MTTQSRLQGIFTPNIVPLDDHGEINEAETRRYVDWLIERGVHGLYPNGSTGEFTRFTAEERRRIIEIIADQTRGRVPILAGAAEANTRETIKACEYYHQLGVRAVAIVAPFYYKLSPAGVYAYFKEIADHSRRLVGRPGLGESIDACGDRLAERQVFPLADQRLLQFQRLGTAGKDLGQPVLDRLVDFGGRNNAFDQPPALSVLGRKGLTEQQHLTRAPPTD